MVVFAGLVGSGVAGAIVDKFHWYKGVLIVSFTLATLSTALFTLVLQEDQFWLVFIACTLIGMWEHSVQNPASTDGVVQASR